MHSRYIFEICHERYRGFRGWVDGHSEGSRIDLRSPSARFLWRPDRARAADYVADFERIGRRTLARPTWKGRLKLFDLYFVRCLEYPRALALSGVCEKTFDWWVVEIKNAVGHELARAGLYPPAKYFRSDNCSAKSRAAPVLRG
jgi:hypothetical protein